jgi:hypothetical protein
MTQAVRLQTPAALAADIQDLKNYVEQLQKNAIHNNVILTEVQNALKDLQLRNRETQGFIYVASPFSHSDPEVRHKRYLRAMWYTMSLLKNRQWAYSPIVHCYEMARLHDLATDAIFWMDYNFALLSQARELHVLCLDGWKDSVGVKGEVAFWRHGKGTSVKFVEP